MRRCMQDCLFQAGLWVLGGAALSGIVAAFLGVIIVVGTTTIVTIPAGIVAALVAAATVAVLGFLVAIGWCYVRCVRRR